MNHIFRIMPKEEILSDRCNAYSFIDFGLNDDKLDKKINNHANNKQP